MTSTFGQWTQVAYGTVGTVFEAQLAEDCCSVPRIWFQMLTYAEKLRVMYRDDRELAAVRRLMKKTSGFMFDCYLEKVSGRR